jgi:cell division protein FtsL
MLAGAASVSALVLAAWFPASALYHQHQQLTAGTEQLTQVRREDRALQKEQQQLGSSAEVAKIAQGQYQLIRPGQQAYEVLPPNGSGTSASFAGDPGLQSPVAPSGSSELTSGTLDGSTPATPAGSVTGGGGAGASNASAAPGSSASAAGRGRHASSPGVLSRILQTLEFWH